MAQVPVVKGKVEPLSEQEYRQICERNLDEPQQDLFCRGGLDRLFSEIKAKRAEALAKIATLEKEKAELAAKMEPLQALLASAQGDAEKSKFLMELLIKVGNEVLALDTVTRQLLQKLPRAPTPKFEQALAVWQKLWQALPKPTLAQSAKQLPNDIAQHGEQAVAWMCDRLQISCPADVASRNTVYLTHDADPIFLAARSAVWAPDVPKQFAADLARNKALFVAQDSWPANEAGLNERVIFSVVTYRLLSKARQMGVDVEKFLSDPSLSGPAPAQAAPPAAQPSPAQAAPPVEQPSPAQAAPPAEQPGPAQAAPPAAQPSPAQAALPAAQPSPAQAAPPAAQPSPTQAAPPAEQSIPAQVAPTVEQPSQPPAQASAPAVTPPVQSPAAPEQEKETLSNLRAVYNQGYAFPKWIVDNQPQDEQYMRSRVYSNLPLEDKGWDRIQEALEKREPVNIGMKRLYNQEQMRTSFGWAQSYYQTEFDVGRELVPNFSVYTLADVDILATNKDCDQDRRPSTLPKIHIIHSIGFALDNEQQPDYQVWNAIRTKNADEGKEFLLDFYKNLLAQIFTCANDIKAQVVAMVMVGAGAFATLYPGGSDAFQAEIWVPAFLATVRMLAGQVVFIGAGGVSAASRQAFTASQKLTATPYYNQLFPVVWTALSSDYGNVLYVNAWDPHSMIGNGNCGDASMDGAVGMSTNALRLGWPRTNRFLVQTEARRQAVPGVAAISAKAVASVPVASAKAAATASPPLTTTEATPVIPPEPLKSPAVLNPRLPPMPCRLSDDIIPFARAQGDWGQLLSAYQFRNIPREKQSIAGLQAQLGKTNKFFFAVPEPVPDKPQVGVYKYSQGKWQKELGNQIANQTDAGYRWPGQKASLADVEIKGFTFAGLTDKFQFDVANDPQLPNLQNLLSNAQLQLLIANNKTAPSTCTRPQGPNYYFAIDRDDAKNSARLKLMQVGSADPVQTYEPNLQDRIWKWKAADGKLYGSIPEIWEAFETEQK